MGLGIGIGISPTLMTGVGGLPAEFLALYSTRPAGDDLSRVNTLHSRLATLGKWPTISGAVYRDDYATLAEAMADAVAQGKALFVGDESITADVTLPAGLQIVFEGAWTGNATSRKVTINDTGVFVFDARLNSAMLQLDVNSDGAVVGGLLADGADNALRVETNRLLWQSRANNWTVIGLDADNTAGTAIQINGCENGHLEGLVRASCTDGYACYGYRGLYVKLEIEGRHPAGLRHLAFDSVSGPLGFIDGVFEDCHVRDCYDPDNQKGEAISIDCNGNSAANCSCRLTTTVAAVGSNYITPTTNTTAFGALDYVARFQTGALAGQAFTVEYQGASGDGNWQLADGFPAVTGSAAPGDVVTLEIPSASNIVRNPRTDFVDDVDTPRLARHAFVAWGMGGWTVVNPTGSSTDGEELTIVVRSLRGVQGGSYDYAVANDVVIEDMDQAHFSLNFGAESYDDYPLPISHNNGVRNSSGNALTIALQQDFINDGNSFVAAGLDLAPGNILPAPAAFESWSRTGIASVTANAIAGVAVAADADLVIEDAAASGHRLEQLDNVALTAGTWLLSCWVSAATGTRGLGLDIFDTGGANGIYVTYGADGTLLDGPGAFGSGYSSLTTNGGEDFGFRRIDLGFTLASPVTATLFLSMRDGAAGTYAGDGASGLYFGGAVLRPV